MFDDAVDTEDENIDPTFHLNTSMKSDVNHLAEIEFLRRLGFRPRKG